MLFRSLCVIFLFLTFAMPLAAEPGLSFRQEVDRKIIQRLEWNKDDFAYNYLIEIQLQEGTQWLEVVNETTDQNFIELSLLHGSYRYRVTPSDLLGRRGKAPEWARLSITQLFQPELITYSPDAFYLEDIALDDLAPSVFTLELSGENLRSDSKIYLRSPNGAVFESTEISASADGKHARVEYQKTKLKAGLFDIVIENPGNLTDVLRNFRIAETRDEMSGIRLSETRFSLSQGYAPFVAFPGVFNDYFGRSFFELGFMARLGWLPFTFAQGKWGFEFQPSYHYLSSPINNPRYSDYTIYAQFFELRTNVVYSLPLPFVLPGFNVNARLGIGIIMLIDVHLQDEQLSSPPKNGWIPHIGVGFSATYLFFKNFYVEAGFDFLYAFSVDTPAPGYFMPAITVGFKF